VEDLAGGRTSMGSPNFAARPRDERHPSAGAGPEASKERERREIHEARKGTDKITVGLEHFLYINICSVYFSIKSNVVLWR
jgi:hypothetical protein